MLTQNEDSFGSFEKYKHKNTYFNKEGYPFQGTVSITLLKITVKQGRNISGTECERRQSIDACVCKSSGYHILHL